jgi:hypothetical protein
MPFAIRSEEMVLKNTLKVFEVLRLTLKNKVYSKDADMEKLINMRLVQKPVLPYVLEVCQVIFHKGKRWVSLSSADRGSLVTIGTCMNATITYVPPLLVFLGTT